MNINEHKLDVKFDTKEKLLYATVTVPSIPKKRGVKIYKTPDVLSLLEKQGYMLKLADCISKTGNVRTDYENSTCGTWVFQLAFVKEKAPKKTPVVVEETLVAVAVKKPKKTRKPRTKKATKGK